MTKIYWLSLLAFLLIGASVQGQSNLNFGRTVRQQADELPHSNSQERIFRLSGLLPEVLYCSVS